MVNVAFSDSLFRTRVCACARSHNRSVQICKRGIFKNAYIVMYSMHMILFFLLLFLHLCLFLFHQHHNSLFFQVTINYMCIDSDHVYYTLYTCMNACGSVYTSNLMSKISMWYVLCGAYTRKEKYICIIYKMKRSMYSFSICMNDLTHNHIDTRYVTRDCVAQA